MHYFNEMDLYVNSHSLIKYQWLISGRVKISPVIVKSSERIGEHLSTWRRIEDITAQELTACVGAGADTIGRLEHGDSSVGLGKVLAVSRVIGILTQVEESFDPASTERGRLRLVESVPKRGRRS